MQAATGHAEGASPSRVVLWGADHPNRGSVDLAGIDSEAVIALSAGLHPKPYPHLDPNEDAVLAAVGQRWRLLAVADGHGGFDAAAGALQGIQGALDGLDELVTVPAAGLDALATAAVRGVEHALVGVERRRRGSQTALTIALTGPQAMHVCQWGDTAALRVREGKAKRLASPGPFLSARGEGPRRAVARVRTEDVVCVASDGVTGYLGRDWVRRIGRIVWSNATLEAGARALVHAAFSGGAGDHIAAGIMFAGPGQPGGPQDGPQRG